MLIWLLKLPKPDPTIIFVPFKIVGVGEYDQTNPLSVIGERLSLIILALTIADVSVIDEALLVDKVGTPAGVLVGVLVSVGVNVLVGVNVGVGVEVRVGVNVSVGVGVNVFNKGHVIQILCEGLDTIWIVKLSVKLDGILNVFSCEGEIVSLKTIVEFQVTLTELEKSPLFFKIKFPYLLELNVKK